MSTFKRQVEALDFPWAAPEPDFRMLLGMDQKPSMPNTFVEYMTEAGVDNLNFIRRQWNLLVEGVRDVRIHDAACVAWSRCGGKV